MLILIFYFCFSLGLSIFFIPFLKDLANFFNWKDIPNARKIHNSPIPSLGGIAIFCSVILTLSFLSESFLSEEKFPLLIGCTLIFLLGVWDDFLDISATKRLTFQFLIAIICLMNGDLLTPVFEAFGLAFLPVEIQWLVTIVFLILMINAFNLIDGIDGLCSSLILFISLSFSLLFAQSGNLIWSSMALSIAGGTLGFLFFNFNRASIFLGDNGSTYLGLVVAIFFLKFINAPSQGVSNGQNALVIFNLFSIPIFDLIRVSIQRMRKGGSPFRADQTHIHHLVLKIYKSHQKATLLIVGLQIALFYIANTFSGQIGGIWTLLLTGVIYLLFLQMIQISSEITAIKKTEHTRRSLGILS